MVTIQLDPTFVEFLDGLVVRWQRLYPYDRMTRAELMRRLLFLGATDFERKLRVEEEGQQQLPFNVSLPLPRGVTARKAREARDATIPTARTRTSSRKKPR